MDIKIQIPDIPEAELTPTVKALLDIISQCVQVIEEQRKEIQTLKDEIARLKGGTPKPKIRPSTLDKDLTTKKPYKRGDRRKRNKKRIKIHQEEKLQPETIPPGSEFKEYKNFIVQDIILQANNTKYRRGLWKTPEGEWMLAPLPEEVDGHFGISLKQYILHLSYDLNVPQKKILESLWELGIQISAGELHAILTEGHEKFHIEKDDILDAGLKIFSYVSVDDTGARHQGRNGYCTHIGNEFFSYFKSTESKSRINFLKILRGKKTDYILTEESFDYMTQQELTPAKCDRLKGALGRKLSDDHEWESFLKMIGVRGDSEVKTVTEAALLGSILSHGINRDLVIVSDDAGQFDIFCFLHALCWLHAERKLTAIVPINDYQKNILDVIRKSVWELYNELKSYKQSPDPDKKMSLERRFDMIFAQKTEFETINKALRLIYENKKELLLVLERPEIPLHNNISENSIRVYVTKRKVHGGTRSEQGRQCRDTFISLKKTCRKLGISFRDYLLDRLSGKNTIPPLHMLMTQLSLQGV